MYENNYSPYGEDGHKLQSDNISDPELSLQPLLSLSSGKDKRAFAARSFTSLCRTSTGMSPVCTRTTATQIAALHESAFPSKSRGTVLQDMARRK